MPFGIGAENMSGWACKTPVKEGVSFFILRCVASEEKLGGLVGNARAHPHGRENRPGDRGLPLGRLGRGSHGFRLEPSERVLGRGRGPGQGHPSARPAAGRPIPRSSEPEPDAWADLDPVAPCPPGRTAGVQPQWQYVDRREQRRLAAPISSVRPSRAAPPRRVPRSVSYAEPEEANANATATSACRSASMTGAQFGTSS